MRLDAFEFPSYLQSQFAPPTTSSVVEMNHVQALNYSISKCVCLSVLFVVAVSSYHSYNILVIHLFSL